jgi:hypothetical protein
MSGSWVLMLPKYTSAKKKKAAYFPENLVPIYQTVQCHNRIRHTIVGIATACG